MNPTLSKKIAKVVSTDIAPSQHGPGSVADVGSMLNGVWEMGYTSNSLSNRRELRSLVERRELDNLRDFLTSYESLLQLVESVRTDVVALRKDTSSVVNSLNQSQQLSAQLLSNANSLRMHKVYYEGCSSILEAFLVECKLSQETLAALRSEPSPRFFEGLRHVKQISNDSKVLLKFHEKRLLGIEIAEMMYRHISSANMTIAKWIRSHSQAFLLESPTYDPVFRESLHELTDPAMLEGCLSDISSQRNRAILKSFHVALTVGTGSTKPIEINAHDPLRYVGDMLGWLHQAIASEYELICSLLTPPGAETEHNVTDYSTLSVELQKLCDKSIEAIMENVVMQFKVRLEQAIEHQAGNVVIFRMANLIDFYCNKISTLLHSPESHFIAVLHQCQVDTLNKFTTSISNLMDKVLGSPPSPPLDLVPPLVIRELISLLSELIKSFNSSLTMSSTQQLEIAPLLDSFIQPLLKVCTMSAALSKFDESSVSVYVINCAFSIQTAVMSTKHQDVWSVSLEMLQAQIDANMDSIVHLQSLGILSDCGILSLVSTISRYHSHVQKLQPDLAQSTSSTQSDSTQTTTTGDNHTSASAPTSPVLSPSPTQPAPTSSPTVESSAPTQSKTSTTTPSLLCEWPGMDFDTVHGAILLFEGVLHDAVMLPVLERIISSELRIAARERIGSILVQHYTTLYNTLSTPSSGYPDVSLLCQYTPAQVKMVLGC
ncbi:oligomeric Golgi complex component [Pelomyxa schiedti]|nr:oligomeric Golgi complex component [Pelomyxa schiedti]